MACGPAVPTHRAASRVAIADVAPTPARAPVLVESPAAARAEISAPLVPPALPAPTIEPFEGTPFPPPDVPPPHVRTAATGDGRWQRIDAPNADGRVRMVRTRLHNHPLRRDKYIDVVAVDRALVDLALVVGKDEPQATVAPERRTGLVPARDHDALLAVFNGGFMQRHGNWGMMHDGDVYTPPRDEACTIAGRADGRIAVATWSTLEGKDALAWWRQTPPCLVEGGRIHARLLREPGSGLWGKSLEGHTDIRRSALALDASRRVLFYVFSEWNNANELAHALVALGATDAAELDINWSYTRFFWFEHPPGAPPRIGEALVPKLDFDRRRYVERAAERDFFYLRRRGDPAR